MRITEPKIQDLDPRQVLYASISKKRSWMIGIILPIAIHKVAKILTSAQNKAKDSEIIGPPVTKTKISQIHAPKPSFQIGFPFKSSAPIDPGKYVISSFPTQKVVSLIFTGNYKTLPENPYDKLLKFCKNNQYEIEDYIFEILHDDPREVPKEKCRIEIQIPLKH